MKLLLDTHVWLWALGDPERLSTAAGDLLADPEHELWLSTASVWEAQLLAQRNRIRVDTPVAQWLERQLSVFPLRDAAITRAVVMAAHTLSLPHNDPMDRFIAATAVVEGLQLLTADQNLLSAPECPTISAR